MATIEVECDCCLGGRRPFRTGEGNIVPCPYCKDTGKRKKNVPHPSHVMGEWSTEIRCPGSTPRFYGVRRCIKCGEEELSHPAGHFLSELLRECNS